MIETPEDEYDVIIIGAGMVGASLAVALGVSNKKLLVIEPSPIHTKQQPSFDERTVALTHSAKLIYSGMGIWGKIYAEKAEPILDIHISNQGHFGITHLSHHHSKTDALGYVVPTRVIGNVLWECMSEFTERHTLLPGICTCN